MIKVARLPAGPVRYLEVGAGKPMVLIHAFPLNAEQWLPQLSRAPAGWRVVAPDLGGVRAEEKPAGMDDYADQVFELMSHLGINDAVVAGLSMGGYVAFAMLRRVSARIAGLVLADTRAAADTEEGRAGRDRMLQLVAREGPRGVADAMLSKLLGETTRRQQPDLADAVRRLIESNATSGIRAAVRAMKERPDSTSLLPSITCPTTIICGSEDTLTPPAESEAMHQAIAGSHLVILPRSGHLSNIESPFGFSDALFGSSGG